MNNAPYAVMSDTHCHYWHQFAQTWENGVNSRLLKILNEFYRCAKTLHEKGGTDIIHTGDLFHVRGNVSPSVFNPTIDIMRQCNAEFGTQFRIIAGNHDCENSQADYLTNAVAMIRQSWCQVISEPVEVHDQWLFIPWIESIPKLKEILEQRAAKLTPANYTLFIHAPVDGVLIGIPDHGLTASYLASLGFKRVFAGHYHNHKHMGGEVYSVGALTHQTWNDVDTLAGFLIVDKDGVTQYPTKAPKFIDLLPGITPEEIQAIVPGNFVRAMVPSGTKASEVKALREALEKAGALGTRIDTTHTPKSARTVESSVKAGASTDQSVTDYIEQQKLPHKEEVKIQSLKVLAEARS